MSTWLTIPSARPMAEAGPRLQKWREMGYRIALWRNGLHRTEACPADYILNTEAYEGWGQSINRLIREVMLFDPSAEWFVGGGDDTLPDPNKRADEIAQECLWQFAGLGSVQHRSCGCLTCKDRCGHFGVMQPTGDLAQWPESRIDNFAGSPWIGREFARRVYNGAGPFPPGLRHMFEDEALQCIAEKLGVFWQRPDLTHRHEHWMRDGSPAPEHLREVNSRAHWNESNLIFQEMKEKGFPGHEPR